MKKLACGIMCFAAMIASATVTTNLDSYVEYIQSSGTQWIDTGVIGKSTVNMAADVMVLSSAGSSCFIGERPGTDVNKGRDLRLGIWINNSYKWALNCGTIDSGWIGSISYQNSRCVVSNENGRLWVAVNGGTPTKIHDGADQTFTSSLTLTMFFLNTSSGLDQGNNRAISARVYGLTLYDNGVIVRDFHPCRVTVSDTDAGTSETKYGLWDKVGARFYGDQSGGTDFTAGDAVANDPVVVVAFDARGFEGVEQPGSYTVNDTQTFSATNLTVGPLVWSPVGYTLEIWDSVNSKWAIVKIEKGASFTYVNAAGSDKVRLKWLWSQLGNVRQYGIGDYIQHPGLFAHFDGVYNAGLNAAHASSVTANWVNLVDGGFNLARQKADAAFSDDAWVANGTVYFNASSATVMSALFAKSFTLEMMISAPPIAASSYATWFFSGDNNSRQLDVDLRSGDSSNPLVQGIQYRGGGSWNADAKIPNSDSPITKWNTRQYIAVVCDGNTASGYCDGTNLFHSITAAGVDPTSNLIGVGAQNGGGSPLKNGSQVCAVRMTAGVLEGWQIEHNSAVDHARFCSNVTVVNGEIGHTGQIGTCAVPDGSYDFVSGTWTITAEDVVVSEVCYSPQVTVEVLKGNVWVVSEARKFTGSYTLDKSTIGDDSVRITWTWAPSGMVWGEIAAGAGGSVSPVGADWFPIDTPLTVTATPDADYRFYRWDGTIPDGTNAFSAAVSFSPSEDFDITALFVQSALVTNTWNGGSGDFETAGMWSRGAAPVQGEVVVIPNAADSGVTDTITVNAALDVDGLVVGGGSGEGAVKLVFKNGLSDNIVAGDVHVLSGATLSHAENVSAKTYVLNLKAGGDITIDSGAVVDVDCCGFKTGGPGSISGGASYGGRGWASGAPPYGSIREPRDLGSNGKSSTTASTWAGGGAIMLDAIGTITVNGTIRARGGLAQAGGGGVGGSGGSILLKAATLAGAGTIDANQSRFNGAKYSGSGGRIALHQRVATDWTAFTGTVKAFGGDFLQQSGAAPGTIFKKHAGQDHGDLVVTAHHTATHDNRRTSIVSSMTDVDLTFDTLIVSSWARFEVGAGVTLKVLSSINSRDAYLYEEDPTSAIELVGSDDFTWLGGLNASLYQLNCTVPGKTLYFGTGNKDMLPILSDGFLVLSGSAGAPLQLLPEDGTGFWRMNIMNVDATASAHIENVAVSNSNASAGSAVVAIDSHDLGGNTYWGFSSAIRPGQTNVWTGASSTAWGATGNWSCGRAPVDTDVVEIPAVASENYPVLSSLGHLFNQLSIGAGASLTLNGGSMTVTNRLAIAGALVCADAETITVEGDVTFSGGTFTAGQSKFVFSGADSQAFDPAGQSFYRLVVSKSGGSVVMSDGFSAEQFKADATAPVTLCFAAGRTVTANGFYLNGLYDSSRMLTLESTTYGTAWNLKVNIGGYAVAGVIVSDSDASSGTTVFAGPTCQSVGEGNVNWNFASGVGLWTGAAGTTDFATDGNWASGAVPADGSDVVVLAADGTAVNVVVPSTHPIDVNRLTLLPTDGTVSFKSDAKVEVAQDFTLTNNVTLTLNAFDEPNVFAGNFDIVSGGVLTHDQLKKLNLSVGGDMTIASGGRVTADRKGYSPGGAPAGYSAMFYGGSMSESCLDCYGSVFNPADWGAGGGGSKYGGGVVMIDVTGTLTVNGAIDACGTYGGNGGWSGAGGSILVHCGTLAGGGRLRANAVEYSSESAYNNSYCGSGGRIAVYQRTAQDWSAYTGTILARGGSATGSDNRGGGAGTVYLESAADGTGGGTIVVDGYHSLSYTAIPAPDDNPADYRNTRLVVKTGNVSVTNSVWHLSKGRLPLKDIDLQSANAKMNLEGSIVSVSTRDHAEGKGWGGTYDALVTENGGEIRWVGGFALFLR